MLRPKVLPKILEQANSSGVLASLLLNKEGSLLASAQAPRDLAASASSSAASASSGPQIAVIAAIFANIWETFDQGRDLQVLLCDCEDGRIAMTQVRALLLYKSIVARLTRFLYFMKILSLSCLLRGGF